MRALAAVLLVATRGEAANVPGLEIPQRDLRVFARAARRLLAGLHTVQANGTHHRYLARVLSTGLSQRTNPATTLRSPDALL